MFIYTLLQNNKPKKLTKWITVANLFLLQIDEYKAHVKLMAIRNSMYELQAAQRSYFAASQLTYQIQMVSFGQRLLFEGRLHQELSTMLLEYGSVQSAIGWSRRALQVCERVFFHLG